MKTAILFWVFAVLSLVGLWFAHHPILMGMFTAAVILNVAASVFSWVMYCNGKLES